MSAIILSALMLMIIISLTLLYFGAQSYLDKNLSEFIQKKSKGKYELSFHDLNISFIHWGFEINQFSFHPSDSVMSSLAQANPSHRLYSFSSPKVRFDGIRLSQLIFKKRLEINEILISQPDLNIHGKQTGTDDASTNLTTLLQELKPLVTKTFESIKIDKIELANASFDFYNLLGDTRKVSNAENVTIGILQFYTDSLILPDPGQVFKAEDIYLKMQNYQNKLADSLHVLTAQTVTYSLKHSRIEALNLELKPLPRDISTRAKYQILVPKAEITSSRINEFYQSSAIPIDSMILTGAKIKYWPGLIKSKFNLESISEFDLYELISDEFSSVSIRNFKLKEAQLQLYHTQTDQASQQELKNINLSLNDFLLDSLSLKDTSRIFYSKDIDLSASEYELTLGDQLHRVRAGALNLSTRNKSVLVNDIQLYPLQTNTQLLMQKNTIEANCDSIRLDSFNFHKAFHQKRYEFQRINLFNPEVKLTQRMSNAQKKENENENASFVYKLISGYLKGVYSNQVSVQKGKIHLVNKTGVLQTGNIESNIKLQLFGLALDEESARRTDRLFFANQIELKFSNYQMQLVDQLHKLTIENLAISTRKKSASLQNLHLFPIAKASMDSLLKKYNRSELYEFTIPELTLSNAGFHEAFFNKKLSIDTLRIKTPQIYFENFAYLKQLKPKAEFEDLFQMLSDYLDNLSLKKVDIADGTVRLINHSRKGKTISLDNHFSLGLENTLINKEQFGQKRLLFSEFVDFTVRDHIFRLSDNVHVLKAREVGFSTRHKEVFALDAYLYPETDSKDFSSVNWNIQLAIPEIRILGIDINDLYFDRKINAGNLLINSPEIKLYQKRKASANKDIKEIAIPLPKEIESIAFDLFQLKDGSLKVFSEIGTQPYLLVQSDLRMMARNIFIQQTLNSGSPEFKKGEYTAEMFQFKFTPKDKNQQISIEDLNFSTVSRKILAHHLSVKPKTRSNTIDQFELFIPSLSLNGFDLDQAYKDNYYLFESVDVEKPSVQLYNNARDSLKINPFEINLYPHFESFADVFASKSLNVKDAEITVFKNKQKQIQEKITFRLSDVRIDNKPSRGFMHSTDFSFLIPGLKRQDKFYQYFFGPISYSSKTNRFTAKNIQIAPIFSKEKFQQKVDFQTDYLKGKIDSICIVNPNIRKWFVEESITGRYLSVNGLNLEIYRDKRKSFDEQRRGKMLQDMIKSSRYPFLIDSLQLVNSTISYSEHPESNDQEGKISFTNIHARLMPFSNMKSPAGKIPDFRLEASATVMDSSRIDVKMNYRMDDPENLFTVKGSASPFNMHILNPVLEPLASVSLRSGRVDRFEFDFSATNISSTGKLFFGYHDLKISVLEKKEGGVKEAKFASFLANSLLLRSKNPRGNELLPDEINFRRDPKRSVLNYWWKSVFSGVRNTLGLKENKQENPE